MAEEGEQQELKEYQITKYDKDGNPQVDKSSEHYTGKAQVQYPNGDVYDGMFNDGVREGEGTMTYGESGNKYVGQWKNNLKDGIGKMTFGTNGEYTGHFSAGKRDGEGVYKYTKTKDLYSGSWKDGLKNGKGTFIFNATKMKLVGDWVNGQIVKGKWIFANGTYFEGQFENNYPKGEGVWHFANGNTIKGGFSQDIREVEDRAAIPIKRDEEGNIIPYTGKIPMKTVITVDWTSDAENINYSNYLN